MHRSKLGGFIIDCRTDDLEAAAGFWSQALGAPAKPRTNPLDVAYVGLEMRPREPHVEVQKVGHASRVHLDIETDDLDREVARLEALGARRLDRIRDWCVMEAPTGQRFCVVPVQSDDFAEKAREWP